MVDQHRSRDPKGGRDVFLRNLVLCKLFVNDDSGNSEKKEIQKKTDENSNFPPRGTQMPAHMCRHLQMHIRESIVALDTTEIRNVTFFSGFFPNDFF